MSSHPWELAWKEGRWYETSSAFPAVIEFGKRLKNVGAKWVLDFGSGGGRHSVHLANQGFSVVGFDISRSALNMLRDRTKSADLDISPVQGDMTSLPFADNSSDAIVGNNVLHHARTAEISKAVDEIYRVLKIGADGYFSVLSENDYKFGSGKLVEPWTYMSAEEDELGIIHHFFTERSLRTTFERFEVESLEEDLIPIETGNRGHFHLRFRKTN